MASVDSRSRVKQIYASRLRTALEETGTSIYRLSRNLNPQQPDSARSNIQRYLAGKVLPGIESRHELAESLGRPELRSVPDEDDERDVMSALANAIRLVVMDQLKEGVKV